MVLIYTNNVQVFLDFPTPVKVRCTLISTILEVYFGPNNLGSSSDGKCCTYPSSPGLTESLTLLTRGKTTVTALDGYNHCDVFFSASLTPLKN